MKIRLPNLPSLRKGPAPAPTTAAATPGGAPEPAVGGGFADRLRMLSRRTRGSAGWVFLALGVFIVFVWISLPTRAIAWRIGQEARKAGYQIDIEDVSLRPWGSVTLYNLRWTYAPSHPGQVPDTLALEAVDVDVGVLAYLFFGDLSLTIDTLIDEAPVHAEYSKTGSETTIKLDIAELPFGRVPKLQQMFGAPMKGLVAVHADITAPENLFAKAEGELTLECAACAVGDGESLLFVPGATGIAAKGMTVPEIDIGSFKGRMAIKEGKATAEDFGTKSPDVELVVTGDMAFKDPFSKSEFNFVIKLLVTQALQDKSETLRFAVQTAGPSSKMDPPEEGWLGFKLKGKVGRPEFMGIKRKSNEERMLEKRKKAEEAAAKKRRQQASREKPKKEPAKKPDAAPADETNTKPEGKLDLAPVNLNTGDGAAAPSTSFVPSTATPPSREEPAREEPAREEETKPAEPPPPPEPPQQPEGGGEGQGQGQGQGQEQPAGEAPPTGEGQPTAPAEQPAGEPPIQ